MNSDIELEICAGSEVGNYTVRVIHSAAGGEPVSTLRLDVQELLSRRDVLEATVRASGVVARGMVPANERPLREVGRQLFEALFTGPVYGTYRASLGAAQQRGKRLRLVLRLSAPELAALPWEMLFDPETETYLCRQEPLVRHVHAPYTESPLEVCAPIRVLGLVASPRGLPLLDVEAEKDHLAEALAGPIADGLVDLVWLPQATWGEVHTQLLTGEWHVLHFVGHGDYDTRTDEGVLALVGRDGRADMVEASRLADLLGEAQPTPRLVVLNSCSSGQVGANDLFSGSAAALVRSGISAVAAMQFTVTDTAAIAFARGFYTAIAHGRGVDEAARSGRISILGAPGSLEWVTPVMYVRGQTSQLFNLTAPEGADSAAPRGLQATPGGPPAEPAQPADSARRRRAELRYLSTAARAELRLGHFDTAIGLFDDLLTLDPGYPDAAELRRNAQRGRQLANTYALAAAAQEAGDWVAAARGYGELLEIDPDYQDAAARKDACLARHRVADLQAELRYHADAGHWQAVLDVNAELERLDPAASDPDGLASHARTTLGAEQRTADLDRRYAQARAAQDSGDWGVAVHDFDELLEIDPAYRDAAARRDLCRRRYEIVGLQTALEGQAAAGDWSQVLASIETLTGLDKAAAAKPAYTQLADRARRELTARPAEPFRVIAGGRTTAVSWHPDGCRIAVARSDSAKARVYDLDLSGNRPKEVLTVKGASWATVVFDVAFSPDGTRLATAGGNNMARVWDAVSGRKLLEVCHGDVVWAVAFSPDGARLVTGSGDTTACVWDAASGRKLLEVRHDGRVRAVAFSPDGTRLATGTGDNEARVWDAASGRELLEIRHDNPVLVVAFSPDGTRLATNGKDNRARVWDAVSGRKLLEVRHDSTVRAVAFNPDGTLLATAGHDNKARIWDAASGQKLLEISHDNLGFRSVDQMRAFAAAEESRSETGLKAVAFSPDGTRLATAGVHWIAIWPVVQP